MYINLCYFSGSLSLQKKRCGTEKSNPGRKRILNKDNWKCNLTKRLRNLGKEYVNKKGQKFPQKQMEHGCSYTCLRNCRQCITHNEREALFKAFWNMGDHNMQVEHVSRFVRRVPKKQVIVTAEREMPSRRKWSYEYYLLLPSRKEIRVCKKMFLDTFSISDIWIQTMFKKLMLQFLAQ